MKEMDELKKKYWKGRTDRDEERSLKNRPFSHDTTHVEDIYFQYLNEKKNEKINFPDFDVEIIRKIKGQQGEQRFISKIGYWRLAAAVIILITAGILFFNNQSGTQTSAPPPENLVLTDTYNDPEKAFEETKKALLFISNKLNKGTELTSEFAKFSETQENLKKEN